MQIEKKTLNWLPKPSAYDFAQQQSAKRRAQAQAYISDQSSLAGSLSTVASNLIQGQGELAAKVAMTRLGIKKTA